MSLSLSQRVALNEQKNKGRRKNVYGPSFLALKTDINKALQDGWSMRQIWSTLKDEKKIACSYLWFRILVKSIFLTRLRRSMGRWQQRLLQKEKTVDLTFVHQLIRRI